VIILHRAQCPEIAGELRGKQVRIRHGEIAFHSPRRAPRIAHDKTLRAVVVTDRKHRVAADNLLTGRRHVEHTVFRNADAFKHSWYWDNRKGL